MKHLLILALLISASAAAFAQTPGAGGNPIEITATETVEWLRDQQQYVARKDVIIKQGAMEIHADLVTADYREGAQSSTEIYQMTAEGNVQIKDETNTAYGDKGVYDVIGGVAVLTGGDLKLVSPDQTVTASERMEYHANDRLAKAIGNATVIRATDTLKANTLTAYFTEGKSTTLASSNSPLGGGGNIDRLEADGNVVIKTPTETIRGSKAVYRASSNTAEISGNVKIERGENVLEGARAEVDLTTNVSKMFGSKTEGGRVRGVFFPGTQNNQNKQGQDKPVAVPPSNPAAGGGKIAPVPEGNSAPPVSTTPSPDSPAKVSPRIEY